jgi:23S rRNA (pseudouridine1915-N3)-methyltransferase
MRWHIFAIGKPKLDFAKLGIEEYAARLKPFVEVRFEYLKGSTQAQESSALTERTKAMFRVVLDERGAEISSRAFASRITEWETHSKRDFALIIGGADGHTEGLRSGADWTWALSRLTLQHELALVIALEQLYRAYTIKAGMPYHRD